MKKNIFFGHNDFRFFYYRYKDSNYYTISFFVTIILVSIILMNKIILPQIDNYFSIEREAAALNSQIKKINGNISFMNSLDKSTVDTQLKTVIQALPSENDFSGIIDAISETAIKSGVSIKDFSFQLNGNSAYSGNINNKSESIVPIQLAIEIEGNVSTYKKFLKEILEKIPLAEVLSIEGNSAAIKISLQFYYKPFPKIVFKEDEPISAISNDNIGLIQKLSSWKTDNFEQNIIDSSGTSSAVPLF